MTVWAVLFALALCLVGSAMISAICYLLVSAASAPDWTLTCDQRSGPTRCGAALESVDEDLWLCRNGHAWRAEHGRFGDEVRRWPADDVKVQVGPRRVA